MLIAQCPVCKDTLVRSADIVVAPCGHTYHEFCLFEWLKTKPNCPQCRKQTTRHRVKRLYFDFVEDPSFSSADPEATVARLQAELEARNTKLIAVETLLKTMEKACQAAGEKAMRANATLDEQRQLTRKERAEKDKLKHELYHCSEMLRQALVDKAEAEELRQKMATMKDVEALLRGSASSVGSITAVYVEQAERDSPMAAVRHLARLVAVLKREIENLRSNKRSLRRERHNLLKEVAVLRRQMANDARETARAQEELLQEKTYAAGLERECDSLRAKASKLAAAISSPSANAASSLAKRVALESPLGQRMSGIGGVGTPPERSADDSAADLFDAETTGEGRLLIDSHYFDTPEAAPAVERPRGVNPFALKRRSATTEEEMEEEEVEVVKMEKRKPLSVQNLQNFNILRTHLLSTKPVPARPAVYDGLGGRRRSLSPVFGAEPSRPAPRRKLGRATAKKKMHKAPAGPTLDKFIRRI